MNIARNGKGRNFFKCNLVPHKFPCFGLVDIVPMIKLGWQESSLYVLNFQESKMGGSSIQVLNTS